MELGRRILELSLAALALWYCWDRLEVLCCEILAAVIVAIVTLAIVIQASPLVGRSIGDRIAVRHGCDPWFSKCSERVKGVASVGWVGRVKLQ